MNSSRVKARAGEARLVMKKREKAIKEICRVVLKSLFILCEGWIRQYYY